MSALARMRHPAALALAALLLAVPAARAQATGSVEVTVTEASSRTHVRGARVVVGGRHRGTTDAFGRVRLGGIPAGRQMVEVSAMGHHPLRVAVEVAPDPVARLDAVLTVAPIAMAEVRARAGAPASLQIRDFYVRAENGSGTYFTRADIDRINPRRLTDLLRTVPGMLMIADEDRESEQNEVSLAAAAGARMNRCSPRYFLDGTPLEASRGGVMGMGLRPSEVEGVEVYRGATAPAQFRRAGDTCAVVLIWKRERI